MDKNTPFVGNVLQNPKYKDELKNTSSANTVIESAAHNDRIIRFNAKQGHGYAAEQANDIIDRIHGKTTKIVGDDNAKDGADRVVDGVQIQTKYCNNARASIEAAFRNDTYRYIDKNSGKPMQVEVPKDQYEEAVEIMRKKIIEGKVPRAKPEDAEKLVRKGNVDYQTACNIAKAGTIDSLLFDAAHGMVIATSAMGITATIAFAKAIWDGEDLEKAVDIAMYSGLKAGGIGFATSVLSAQITRTSLSKVLIGPSIQVVRLLPSSVRTTLVTTLRGGVLYGGAATNNLAKLLRNNLIVEAAILFVMSANDITEYFRGRISGQQLFKNMVTITGGLTGGLVGSYVGGIIGSALPIPFGGEIGKAVGGAVGAAVGTEAAHGVAGCFIEDDAVKMVAIINDRIVPLVQNFVLNEEELNIVLEELEAELRLGRLLDMFQSNDREAFADEMLTNIIKNVTRWRARIILPMNDELIKGLGRILELAQDEKNLQEHFAKKKVDTVAIGRKLLGQEISKRAADKAWYVTKQMNIVSTQQEMCLKNMSSNESAYALSRSQSTKELAKYKQELKLIMEEV